MELPAPHSSRAPGPLTDDRRGDGPGRAPEDAAGAALADTGAPAYTGAPGDTTACGDTAAPAARAADPAEDTVDLDLSGDITALLAEPGAYTTAGSADGIGTRLPGGHVFLREPDLLDGVGGWSAASTACGMFQLVPVRIERDLPLVSAWMNDPAVAEFWELAGPAEATAAHLRGLLEGDGRSIPCLGVLDGVPMSYWEIYRADLDPLARHYPARPHDTGLHLLVGGVGDRGRGVGTCLLRAVSDLILAHRPGCRRVLAEPDLRNVPSVAAFLSAGFRFSAEVDLPGKRAALMIRDR